MRLLEGYDRIFTVSSHFLNISLSRNSYIIWVEKVGGVIYSDQKTEVLTVIFKEEDCINKFIKIYALDPGAHVDKAILERNNDIGGENSA